MTVRTGMSERVHPLFALLPCLCHPPGTFCCCVRRRCEREWGFLLVSITVQSRRLDQMCRAHCFRARARKKPVVPWDYMRNYAQDLGDLWLATTEHTRKTQRLPKHPRQTLHPHHSPQPASALAIPNAFLLWQTPADKLYPGENTAGADSDWPLFVPRRGQTLNLVPAAWAMRRISYSIGAWPSVLSATRRPRSTGWRLQVTVCL